jgi:hypothetical protein
MKDDRAQDIPKRRVRIPRAIAPCIQSSIDEEADRLHGEEPAWKRVARWFASSAVILAMWLGTGALLQYKLGRYPWYVVLALFVATPVILEVFATPYRARQFESENWPTPWWYRLRVKRRALLLWGFCPACGYDLCMQMPEDDGCAVCPECGGAWRWSLRVRARAQTRRTTGLPGA